MLKPITKAVNELIPTKCKLDFIFTNSNANEIIVLINPPTKNNATLLKHQL